MLRGMYQASICASGGTGSLHELEKLRGENAALRRELGEARGQIDKLTAALRLWSDGAGRANEGLGHPLTAALTREEVESERLIAGAPLSDSLV